MLNARGEVVHTGTFAEAEAREQRLGSSDGKRSRVRELLSRSRIVRNVLESFEARRTLDAKLELFVAIVAKSQKILSERYDGAELHVVLWDDPTDPLTSSIRDRLRTAAIPVHLVTEILPDYPGYDVTNTTYHIPDDEHPNARAHDLLARYLVEEVLRSEVP